MKIIGLRRLDFVPEGETKSILGWTVYLTFEENGVDGFASDKIFVSDAVLGGEVPQLGSEVEVLFRKGSSQVRRLLPVQPHGVAPSNDRVKAS